MDQKVVVAEMPSVIYLIVGLGNLGQTILMELARAPDVGKIIVATRSVAHAQKVCNLVGLYAATYNVYTPTEVKYLDLTNEGQLAGIVHDEKPDCVVHCAAHMTWWMADLFPSHVAKAIDNMGFGVWLPIHLDLAYRLSRELLSVDYKGACIVGSYPDVVNPILSLAGYTPTAGFGNIEEVASKLRFAACRKYGCRAESVSIDIVGHHSLSVIAFSRAGKKPPHIFCIEINGIRISDYEVRLLFDEPVSLPNNPSTHLITAASAMNIISALRSAVPRKCYVSSPDGLPGGYTADVSRSEIKLLLPNGISQSEAIDINRASQLYDGIEEISKEGSVSFCRENAERMKELIGYDSRRLDLEDVAESSEELRQKYQAFAGKYNVSLEAKKLW